MNLRDWLIGLTVISVWGVNFYFMKLGLADFSPMLLGMLRFLFVCIPLVFFIERPPVRWLLLAAYGLTISLGQFGFMFTALSVGMPTGLAALLLQAQVFFTVLIAALLLKEQVRPNHIAAIGVATLGLLLIGIGQYSGHLPWQGLVLVLCAALSWACGNIVVRKIGRVNPLSLVVWGNAFAIVPFAAMALWQDGASEVLRQLSHAGWRGWSGVLFLAYVASLVGYVGWGALLSRHMANKVTPLALLVPVIAMIVAYFLLDEQLNSWQMAGVALVMGGLLVHVFGGRWLRA